MVNWSVDRLAAKQDAANGLPVFAGNPPIGVTSGPTTDEGEANATGPA